MSSRLNVAGGTNSTSNWRTTTGMAVPNGPFCVAIRDQVTIGGAGNLISRGALAGAAGLNIYYNGTGYRVGGQDDAGNLMFSGGTLDTIGGASPTLYTALAQVTFAPRIHFLGRTAAGANEYWVAEAGQAPVLVVSQTRAFTGLAVGNFSVGGAGGTGTFEGDVEDFMFFNAMPTVADMAKMAAGMKPSNTDISVNANLQVYYPLETSVLTDTANPAAAVTNLGSLGAAVVFRRYGAVANYGDGPMLRGATADNMAAGTPTEPTNVVALAPLPWRQVIGHIGGSYPVPFVGTDYGTGTADIQVRLTEYGPILGMVVGAWQTLVTGSAGGGAAINTTLTVPKGYWQNIEVRRVNSAGGTGDSNRLNRSWITWGVGEVEANLGDSHGGQMDGVNTQGFVAPNGYTAKLGTSTSATGIVANAWNHLRGTTGAIGGSSGENQLANALSLAQGCVVGTMTYWAGATQLAFWNGRLSSAPWLAAKAYFDGNGGLNKPNFLTWVMNRAQAGDISTADQSYADLAAFKGVLDAYLGASNYKWLLMETFPVLAPDTAGGATLLRSNLHVTRLEAYRFALDNPATLQFVGTGSGWATNGSDGVHPVPAVRVEIVDPLIANAALWVFGYPGAVDPVGPRFSKFWRSGLDIYVKVTGLNGASLLLKNGAMPSGFSFSGDDWVTAIAPISGSLFSADTVRLNFSSLPAGQLRGRSLFGAPGVTGSTVTSPANTAAAGTDNILYTDQTILGYQPQSVLPIFGDAASFYSMAEGVADGAALRSSPLLMLMCR